MKTISIYKEDQIINGEITLSGSKSISNRALIIRALCKDHFNIKNLSTSKDTQTLIELLNSKNETLNAGHAGTTFRFMTAFLAFKNITTILTGSSRMQERPIGILVDALNELGANIEYIEKKGFPPLKIHPPKKDIAKNKITIDATVSSQYISALLMIAPTFPQGLIIEFNRIPTSLPYILMTLKIMEYFGIHYEQEHHKIIVFPGEYQAKDFTVEADWSSASYYFSLAAIAQECHLQINGLFKNSLQGDHVISKIIKGFGVETIFNHKGILITKKEKNNLPHSFLYDFSNCPDIAQTLVVICAALEIEAEFVGLKTLRIKETDRVFALQNELKKVGIIIKDNNGLKEKIDDVGLRSEGVLKIENPAFSTYQDHRMAMALAPLSLLGKIKIKEPNVVKKSYPNFWNDLQSLGFIIEEIKD